MDPFSLANIIFLIPLTVGVILAIGSAFGLGGDGDSDHDLDLDADHDYHLGDNALDGTLEPQRHHPLWLRALAALGVGRAPITIVAMTAALLFGGIGLCGNIALGTVLWPVSLGLALVGSFVLTGFIARLVGRLIPSVETAAVGREHLCGKLARVSLGGNDGFAMATLVDEYGTLHQLPCTMDPGVTLEAQDEVIVVSYDEASRRFLVEPARPHFSDRVRVDDSGFTDLERADEEPAPDSLASATATSTTPTQKGN